jgi:hypothetical protein
VTDGQAASLPVAGLTALHALRKGGLLLALASRRSGTTGPRNARAACRPPRGRSRRLSEVRLPAQAYRCVLHLRQEILHRNAGGHVRVGRSISLVPEPSRRDGSCKIRDRSARNSTGFPLRDPPLCTGPAPACYAENRLQIPATSVRLRASAPHRSIA